MAHRVLLDWRAPGLEQACAWLVERFARRSGGWGELDLSSVIVVTPGARAGRILLAMLADRAQRDGLSLGPPTLETPGGVGWALVEDGAQVAGEAATRLAFAGGVRALEEVDRRALTREPVADLSAALGVADLALGAVRELAGELVPIGRAGAAAAELGGEVEGARWRAIERIWASARERLRAHGLEDEPTALFRVLSAGDLGARLRPGVEVVLVGVTELPGVARRALEALGGSVTAMVLGDSLGGFDGLGSLRPDAWAGRAADLSGATLEFVADAREQAHAALAAVARAGERLSADRITIGTPDEEVAFWIERLAERAGGVEVRDGAGWPIERTGPWRLLSAAAELVESGSFAAFSAIVRHPDVERAIGAGPGGGEWLDTLDAFERECMPRRVGEWAWSAEGPRAVLDGVWSRVRGLLGGLWDGRGGPRPAAEWGPEVVAFLARVFAGREFRTQVPAEGRTVEACRMLRRAADDLGGAPGGGAIAGFEGSTRAWEGIGLVMSLAGGGRIPSEPSRDSVEMLGWLELPLDPGEALTVTGMNEGSVPSSRRVDGLLPDRLRERLGLETEVKRAARDSYVLSALAASGRSLTLIAGRRSGEGDPLAPSRLLFSGDESAAVERVRAFLKGRSRWRLAARGASASGFGVAEPRRPVAINSMSVTSFRTYLASPYEFYLLHVLGLEEPGGAADELESATLGSLLHEALRRFGESGRRGSGDPGAIERDLVGHLGDLVRERFGGGADGAGLSMIPRVELEMGRRWLASAARWQAQVRRQRWEVLHCEWRPEAGASMVVDGEAMGLRGRIDRIDVHPMLGHRIIDFKTGNIKEPDKTHRAGPKDGKEWVDLQLPLYRHLVAELNLSGALELGYVGLGKGGAVEWLAGAWDEGALREADATAAEVIRRVRRGEFGAVGDARNEDGSLGALMERAREGP
ncbi:MAG: hypothetical protein FJ255_05705 [Phycisphaerae bacterium]|nr:hypothetical protein [Phycisphaerae bacterium]